MSTIRITFIDVGWGDSILLESQDSKDSWHCALIDSNDSSNLPSTELFLKRHFERHVNREGLNALPYPLFTFVAATHAHADHISGLQPVIRRFGTDVLYTTTFLQGQSPAMANLLRWASRATRKGTRVCNRHQYIHQNMGFPLGDAHLGVLWPPFQHYYTDENDNSLVLAIRLDGRNFVLTGDCKADNWIKNANGWPIALPKKHLKLIQIPHHGAKNGLFDSNGHTPLFDQLDELAGNDATNEPLVVVSCHPRPHDHPHPDVATELERISKRGTFRSCISNREFVRTDQVLHFTVSYDGFTVRLDARPARV